MFIRRKIVPSGWRIVLVALQLPALSCLGDVTDPRPSSQGDASSVRTRDASTNSGEGDGDGGSENELSDRDGGAGGGADAGRDGSAPDSGGRSDAGAMDAATVDGGGDAVPSAGCGRTPTLQTKSTITIQSGGKSRKYILWLPENYDKNHPYRLVLAYHWYTGNAMQVVDCTTEGIRCYTTQSPFYGLWQLSNNSTIFIAPDGLDAGWANSNGRDVTFTDDILKQVEADLCIDTSRVFANGFSYGASMTNALACARPNVFRAVAAYSGTEGLSGCSGGTTAVAFYGSHGLQDGTLNVSGGRQIRDRWVKQNGCTAQNPPSPAVGSGVHTCTSYDGCSSGHPVRWCEFDGSHGHDPSPIDKGQTTTWNPGEVWRFFTQF